jgi:hypothetical protein
MKITNEQLKQLIEEELENTLQEMQVDLGLPHEYSDERLYLHVMNFVRQNPDVRGTPKMDEAKALEKILNNRIRKLGVFNDGSTLRDPENEESLRIQRELKFARRALVSITGQAWKYSGLSQSRKQHYR